MKRIGIDDSVIDNIMSMHGSDIEKHKTDLSTAQTELGALKTQLTAILVYLSEIVRSKRPGFGANS